MIKMAEKPKFKIVEEKGKEEKKEFKVIEEPERKTTAKRIKGYWKEAGEGKEEKKEFRIIEEPEKKKEEKEELKVKVGMPSTSGGSWQERYENIINDVLGRLERVENNNNVLSDEIEEIKESVSEIETNIHELTALYDALSAQYNPFIDLTPQQRKIIGGEEIKNEDVNEKNEVEEEEVEEEIEGGEEENLPPAEPIELQENIEENVKKEVKREKGYILSDIPDNSESHMIAIKWTEFMIEKVGAENIRKLLEYYRMMRWISDGVVNKIMHQVRGLNTGDIKPEYQTWKMDTNDHMKTLIFLEKIKGGDMGTIQAEEIKEVVEDIKKE